MGTTARDGDPTADRLLDTDEVARHLGIPPNGLKMRRYRRRSPPWFKLGRPGTRSSSRRTATVTWPSGQPAARRPRAASPETGRSAGAFADRTLSEADNPPTSVAVPAQKCSSA